MLTNYNYPFKSYGSTSSSQHCTCKSCVCAFMRERLPLAGVFFASLFRLQKALHVVLGVAACESLSADSSASPDHPRQPTRSAPVPGTH